MKFPMKDNITAIILAGGKSSRMGTEKGLVKFRGKKMVELVLENVRPLASEVLIVSSNKEYHKLGYAVIEDIHKDCGPLGGIHAGLVNSKSDWNLVVACDLPLVTTDFFSFLVSQTEKTKALIPVHDLKLEPLCGLYHKSALPEIESLLLKKELKMQNAVQQLAATFVEVPKEKFDPSVIFQNVNTPDDVPVS